MTCWRMTDPGPIEAKRETLAVGWMTVAKPESGMPVDRMIFSFILNDLELPIPFTNRQFENFGAS